MSRDGNERPAAPASANRPNQSSDNRQHSAKPAESEVRSRLRRKVKWPNRRCVRINFNAINRAALAVFPAVLARVLPGGKRVGPELVALNPRRADRHLGSFKVNRYNGKWADFATDDKGGDPISLIACLADVSQSEGARLLAQMLGIDGEGRQRE